MNASSADTAELPATGRSVVSTAPGAVGPPAVGPLAPGARIEPRFAPTIRPEAVVVAPGPPAPIPAQRVEPDPPARSACRAELRAQRLQARRLRRRYAMVGLSVLAGTLGATVVVLDMLH